MRKGDKKILKSAVFGARVTCNFDLFFKGKGRVQLTLGLYKLVLSEVEGPALSGVEGNYHRPNELKYRVGLAPPTSLIFVNPGDTDPRYKGSILLLSTGSDCPIAAGMEVVSSSNGPPKNSLRHFKNLPCLSKVKTAGK